MCFILCSVFAAFYYLKVSMLFLFLGDYYVLNGTKFWITNSTQADILFVYAKTNPSADKPQHGISTFIVEKVNIFIYACICYS